MAVYNMLVTALQVIKLQTNLTVLMEPQHPEATPVQSLNYGKQTDFVHGAACEPWTTQYLLCGVLLTIALCVCAMQGLAIEGTWSLQLWETVPCISGVLCCAALRCAALCCAVLCCAVLCCAALCCAVLCCVMVRQYALLPTLKRTVTWKDQKLYL